MSQASLIRLFAFGMTAAIPIVIVSVIEAARSGPLVAGIPLLVIAAQVAAMLLLLRFPFESAGPRRTLRVPLVTTAAFFLFTVVAFYTSSFYGWPVEVRAREVSGSSLNATRNEPPHGYEGEHAREQDGFVEYLEDVMVWASELADREAPERGSPARARLERLLGEPLPQEHREELALLEYLFGAGGAPFHEYASWEYGDGAGKLVRIGFGLAAITTDPGEQRAQSVWEILLDMTAKAGLSPRLLEDPSSLTEDTALSARQQAERAAEAQRRLIEHLRSLAYPEFAAVVGEGAPSNRAIWQLAQYLPLDAYGAMKGRDRLLPTIKALGWKLGVGTAGLDTWEATTLSALREEILVEMDELAVGLAKHHGTEARHLFQFGVLVEYVRMTIGVGGDVENETLRDLVEHAEAAGVARDCYGPLVLALERNHEPNVVDRALEHLVNRVRGWVSTTEAG